jgi:sugar lactone lactonase YvrE
MEANRPLLAVASIVVLLSGCASEPGPTPRPRSSTTALAASTPRATTLRVIATLSVSGASTLVATPRWLWVLGGPNRRLTQVDPATNTVVRRLTSPLPVGYGTFANGSLWLVSFLRDAVVQVDADSGEVLRTIESRDGKPFNRPVGVVATGKDLWVLNHSDGSVRSSLVRLDSASGLVTGTTELPGHHAGGPDLAGGQLWIALTTEGSMVRVDPGTGFVVGPPLAIDSGTCRGASVAAGQVWIAGMDLGEDLPCHESVRRLDPITLRVSPLTEAGGMGLNAFAAAGGSVWASDVRHTIYRVDADSGAVRPALSLTGGDATNRLMTAFGSLWALGGETGRLVRIDVS